MKATTEKAFEAYIHEAMTANGWIAGSNKSWDKQKALFPEYVTAFIKDSQPTLWAQMEKLLGPELPDKLIETLVKERNLKGPLHILRRGFKFYGKTFQMTFFKSAHGLVHETLDLYHKNILHVTHQVASHPTDNSTVDMLLSLKRIKCQANFLTPIIYCIRDNYYHGREIRGLWNVTKFPVFLKRQYPHVSVPNPK